MPRRTNNPRAWNNFSSVALQSPYLFFFPVLCHNYHFTPSPLKCNPLKFRKLKWISVRLVCPSDWGTFELFILIQDRSKTIESYFSPGIAKYISFLSNLGYSQIKSINIALLKVSGIKLLLELVPLVRGYMWDQLQLSRSLTTCKKKGASITCLAILFSWLGHLQ